MSPRPSNKCLETLNPKTLHSILDILVIVEHLKRLPIISQKAAALRYSKDVAFLIPSDVLLVPEAFWLPELSNRFHFIDSRRPSNG